MSDSRYYGKDPHICICPMCNKKYKRELFWTGKNIPRIYCNRCYQTKVKPTDDNYLIYNEREIPNDIKTNIIDTEDSKDENKRNKK